MFLAIKEKRFAKRIIKRLLNSHSIVSNGNGDLSGKSLYRDVLLHAEYADVSSVDNILEQAHDSVELWTASTTQSFGFRQVVHFVVVSRYRASGQVGTVVSFRDIVFAQVSADL